MNIPIISFISIFFIEKALPLLFIKTDFVFKKIQNLGGTLFNHYLTVKA